MDTAYTLVDNVKTFVTAAKLYGLKTNPERKKLIEKTRYFCPYCNYRVYHSQSQNEKTGKVGHFGHCPGGSQEEMRIKTECDVFVGGLMAGADTETRRYMQEHKEEVLEYLEESNIDGYTVIIYYNEKALRDLVEKFPDIDYIIISKHITEDEWLSIENNQLTMSRRAITDFVGYNNKPLIQSFSGASGIFTTVRVDNDEHVVTYKCYNMSLEDLKNKRLYTSDNGISREDFSEVKGKGKENILLTKELFLTEIEYEYEKFKEELELERISREEEEKIRWEEERISREAEEERHMERNKIKLQNSIKNHEQRMNEETLAEEQLMEYLKDKSKEERFKHRRPKYEEREEYRKYRRLEDKIPKLPKLKVKMIS